MREDALRCGRTAAGDTPCGTRNPLSAHDIGSATATNDDSREVGATLVVASLVALTSRRRPEASVPPR